MMQDDGLHDAETQLKKNAAEAAAKVCGLSLLEGLNPLEALNGFMVSWDGSYRCKTNMSGGLFLEKLRLPNFVLFCVQSNLSF